MLKLTDYSASDHSDDSLTLPFDIRQKSRCAARTDNGVEVGVFAIRGQCLRPGMVLTGDEGYRVLIRAAPEQVSIVRCADPLLFARACYHLGNRHVPLQIMNGELRYLRDHVLDHMLELLGLQVEQDCLPFEPEAGAYHAHDH
jgi:urease accessory protein